MLTFLRDNLTLCVILLSVLFVVVWLAGDSWNGWAFADVLCASGSLEFFVYNASSVVGRVIFTT